MSKLAPVSSKGQVVIPAPLRRKLKIKRAVVIREEDGRLVIEPSTRMEDSFGSGGKVMIDAAREISKDRRREVGSELS